MKKIIFKFAAIVTLMAASCSPNTSTEDDQLYEQGIERKHLKPEGK